VSQQNLQKGNFLGINSSSGISLEISELQTNFLWIKMAFRSLGHSSLTVLQHKVTTSSATTSGSFSCHNQERTAPTMVFTRGDWP
jgi:hypothetical protein